MKGSGGGDFVIDLGMLAALLVITALIALGVLDLEHLIRNTLPAIEAGAPKLW